VKVVIDDRLQHGRVPGRLFTRPRRDAPASMPRTVPCRSRRIRWCAISSAVVIAEDRLCSQSSQRFRCW